MKTFLKKQASWKTTSQKAVVLWFFVGLSFFLAGAALAAADDELKNSLRQQMDEMQQQIDNYRANISELQGQSNSLKRDISLLDSKMKAAELEIRRTALAVRQTESGISDKNLALGQADQKISRERTLLEKYVQAVYESDQQGVLEMVLSNEKLSDVFDTLNSLQDVQRGIQESLVAIDKLKVDLASDKQVLEDRREELNGLKVLQEIQRRTLALQQEEKKSLLTRTKGQEAVYQSMMKKAKADAVSIRENLYLLEGVGLSMPLYQAYQYAKQAGNLTGVRPAFLLAVLKKESSWGERVGTGTWRRDMHSRDQKAFIEICDKLNRDPDTTPVSRKPSYGWGGAMGPAQFLPSVWLAYEDQIARLTGHNPPDPWDIEDAFVAAGIKMAQAGGNVPSYNAEWKAAQIYFAGKRWNNPTYYFYGDQVMEMAGNIQSQLNLIGG